MRHYHKWFEQAATRRSHRRATQTARSSTPCSSDTGETAAPVVGRPHTCRGLSERFSLGGPGQLQSMLLILQSKALIVRAALNSSMQQRSGMSGSPFDISWHVPAEVRAALHVTLPVTPFDVEAGSGQDADSPKVQQVEPYSLLADLLLVARSLDGNQLEREEKDYLSDRLSEARTQSVAGRNKSESYLSDRLSEARTQSVAGRNKSEDYLDSARTRTLSPLPVDGSIAILPPDGMPSN